MELSGMGLRKYGVDDHNEYWKKRVSDGRIIERRLHRFLYDIITKAVPAGGNMLDCGVGDGHVFRLCMEKYNVYGVELSDKAIKAYDFPVDNIRIHDLNNGIPGFGIRFDIILLSNVLHWLDNPEELLEEARLLLNNDGFLTVVVPNITNYHYRIAYFFGKFPPISLSHKNFQTPNEAEAMFRKSGYHILKRLSPKKSIKARLRPTLFGTDIVYLLKPL